MKLAKKNKIAKAAELAASKVAAKLAKEKLASAKSFANKLAVAAAAKAKKVVGFVGS